MTFFFIMSWDLIAEKIVLYILTSGESFSILCFDFEINISVKKWIIIFDMFLP